MIENESKLSWYGADCGKIEELLNNTIVPSFKFEGDAKRELDQLVNLACHFAFEFESPPRTLEFTVE